MRITRQTFDAMPTHSQVLVGDKSMGSMQPQLHRPRDREIGHVVSVCSGMHAYLRHRVTKAGSLSTTNTKTPLLISFLQSPDSQFACRVWPSGERGCVHRREFDHAGQYQGLQHCSLSSSNSDVGCGSLVGVHVQVAHNGMGTSSKLLFTHRAVSRVTA